jgi:hypothetical protein
LPLQILCDPPSLYLHHSCYVERLGLIHPFNGVPTPLFSKSFPLENLLTSCNVCLVLSIWDFT